MARIAVIVPVYNVADYLDFSLESLRVQTFSDIEVICVDDGSTDASPEILRAWAKRDERIRIITKENGGLSSARNAGLAAATAPLVAFLDSDDRFAPNACEVLVRIFERDGSDVVTFGGNCYPKEAEYPWLVENLSPRDMIYEGFCPDLLFREMSHPFVWRTACKRAFLSAHHVRFDEGLSFGEDMMFHAAVYPRARRVSLITDKLYDYRVSRSGSLMDAVGADRRRMLGKHVKIVERVLRDWRDYGLLRENPADVLGWVFEFAAKGAFDLPDEQAREILRALGACLSQHWEPGQIQGLLLEPAVASTLAWCLGDGRADFGALRRAQLSSRFTKLSYRIAPLAMRGDVKKLGLCRGAGKTYALVETGRAYPMESMFARAAYGGAQFPCGIYPVDAPGGAHRWALEVPASDFLALRVHIEADGEEIGAIDVNAERAKWESRLSYRLRKTMCGQIRDIEQRFTEGRYQMRVMRLLDGGDGFAIWRLQVVWRGSADARPVIEAIDGRGCHFAPRCFFMEFQKACEGGGEHRLFLSVELPAYMRTFTLVARSATSEEALASGFTSINPAAYEGFRRASFERMKDAAADDAAYGAWFANHRAKKEELAAQASQELGGILFSVVVPCYRSDAAYLDELLDSMLAQSYGAWELLLVDATPEEGVVARAASSKADSRIRRIERSGGGSIVANTNFGIAAAHGDYIAFLDHDDALEPDALFRYAQALHDDPAVDVLYCDEDHFERKGTYFQPVFKTELDEPLLLSHNYVTHFLAVRRALIERIGVSPEDVNGAQDYDLTLRALAAGARFHHVPRVLYHWRVHPGSTSGENGEAKPYAEEAGRLAVERYLKSLGIAATVETTKYFCIYRVRYELPEPHALVSVLIPSCDHIDLLRTCVASLFEKATYDAFEVVVVENNSVEERTFAGYRELEERYGARFRVVRWPRTGFNYSALVNYGAEQARGEYLLLLNNDTEVIAPNFMEEMLACLLWSDVGVVGAKLYFRDGLTQHAGILVGPGKTISHVNQDFHRGREGYRNRAILPGYFSAVTGACQMVRRSAFDAVGGYDEDFAVGFNDADFCLRLRRVGYRTVFMPYAELYHYEFMSRGREEADPEKLKRWERERYMFHKRWEDIFEKGDPFSNPNFDSESTYYALGG